MMMIASMGGKMTGSPGKEPLRLGDSIIVDYKEIKLEKFDAESAAFDISKILSEQLPMIKSAKVYKHLDYGGRYKIDLMFNKPALSSGNQRIEGININLSSLRKATDTENYDIWAEITPKE